jgi:hypothetical protein
VVPNATEVAASVLPVSGLPEETPVIGSRTRTYDSLPPEASSNCPCVVVPNATEVTVLVWPVSSLMVAARVGALRTRTDPSLLPEASSSRPSLVVPNATEVTASVWSIAADLRQRHAGWQVWFVPKLDRTVTWCARPWPLLNWQSPEQLEAEIAQAHAEAVEQWPALRIAPGQRKATE